MEYHSIPIVHMFATLKLCGVVYGASEITDLGGSADKIDLGMYLI